ncbi:isochorismate synthase [Teredinibacter haidensis]|uniref:isochorismate synthase n=1 Tax=Teredinibacter haidensis TaxID=2731755 RepID=UPI0009F8C290|nr:isochorismate synthase [Teredinibacter haidensis]
MTTPLNTSSTTVSPLVSGLNNLLHQLKLCRFRSHTLVRVDTPILPVDLLLLLASVNSPDRSYFSHRDQSFSVAGLGIAVELEAAKPSAMADLLAEAERQVSGSEAVWIGGCAFNGRSGTHQWQGFPGARFVLPLVEVRQERGKYSLAINLYVESFGQWQKQLLAIHTLLRSLCQQQPTVSGGVVVEKRHNSVNPRLWREQVQEALTRIDAGELKKVVLAREVELELAGSANPFLALKALQQSNPCCYSFAIEKQDKLFFGCSPERLFHRRGRVLHTEALAGTVKRGLNPEEDLVLEQTLLHDPKLVLEHELVAKAIEESLQPLALHLFEREPVEVVKLGKIQHRYQALRAAIDAAITNNELYQSLHPTPAICGYPCAQAQALINEIEQAGRGWYSGNVGLIGDGYCEFSVAIRSALSDQNRLWLYSGVGIVEGSDADEEWLELESKLESMLQALGNNALALNCNA